MTTKAVPVPGHTEHDGCSYHAPWFAIEGAGTFWFCNKCGQGGEVFPLPANGRRPDDGDA